MEFLSSFGNQKD